MAINFDNKLTFWMRNSLNEFFILRRQIGPLSVISCLKLSASSNSGYWIREITLKSVARA